MDSVDKGTRVAIVKGRNGNGVVGTVFWIGDDKYDEGKKRLGVRGDDGDTYWVSADNVEPSNVAEAPPEQPAYERGDCVEFEHQGELGIGEVFWIGPSKHGPGYRVGLKLPGDEDLWLDSRQVKRVLDGPAEAGGAPPTMDAGDPGPTEAPPMFEDGDPGPTEAPPFFEDGDPGYVEVPPMPEEFDEEGPPF